MSCVFIVLRQHIVFFISVMSYMTVCGQSEHHVILHIHLPKRLFCVRLVTVKHLNAFFVMLLICTFHINCKRISVCLFSNIKRLVFGEEWHNVTELCSFSIYMTFVCLLRIYMQLHGM